MSFTVNQAKDPDFRKGRGLRNAALFGLKFAFTALCFWYIFRGIQFTDLVRTARSLDVIWVGLAVAIVMFQIPLAAVRWNRIISALDPSAHRISFAPILAIFWMTTFAGQIMPGLVSDAARVWLLARLGRGGWRQGLAGVLIDRGVGVGALLALGFVTLLIPSSFAALGGYRLSVLTAFGVALVAGIGGLVLAPLYAPLLSHLRPTRFLGEFALVSRRVLIGSSSGSVIVGLALAIHVLSIVCIWTLSKAFAFNLSIGEAFVLFTLMVAIMVLPISVGGWGLRELAVTAFLSVHGIPAQQAFLFSVCFGVVLIAASTPGAVIMMIYSPRQANS